MEAHFAKLFATMAKIHKKGLHGHDVTHSPPKNNQLLDSGIGQMAAPRIKSLVIKKVQTDTVFWKPHFHFI